MNTDANLPDVPSDESSEMPSNGVLATFEVHGERFRVWMTNAQTIQQVMDLHNGASLASIPNGRVAHGAGPFDHNAPHAWHLDAEDIELTEAAIELCDGLPSFVDDNVEMFVHDVGHYCPWHAQLVEVQDFR